MTIEELKEFLSDESNNLFDEMKVQFRDKEGSMHDIHDATVINNCATLMESLYRSSVINSKSIY